MEIILVRHGESLFNQLNRSGEQGRIFSGQSDVPLTEKGRQQAQRLQDLTIWQTVDQVYASPLKRAYETALLATNRQDIIQDGRLKERSLGIFDGKRSGELSEWQAFFDQHNVSHSFTDKAPEGENYADVEKRVGAFLIELLNKEQDGKVAIFSHFIAMRIMIKLLLNLSEAATLNLKIKNSSPLYFQGEILGEFKEVEG